MTKVTLITVVNSQKYPKKKIQEILKNSIYDFEIILINNSPGTTEDLIKLTTDDKRVKLKENHNNNLMQLLNDSIHESKGKYIIFTNSLYILTNDTLKRAYNKLEDNKADLLMFDQNTRQTTIISRLVRDKTFNYTKISEYLLELDFSLHNFIYDKNFLITNNITFNPTKNNDILVFAYKNILKAKRITFFNKQLTKQKKHTYNEDYNDYINNLEEIQELFNNEDNPQLNNQINNFRISNVTKEYENINNSHKKDAFTVLRNNFIKILQSKDSENFIKSLNNENRKKYEQIIISETVEEYELMKKVSQDKKHINYMKRYEKILKVEQNKISSFNKSLTSSNSWKVTKILRIGKNM